MEFGKLISILIVIFVIIIIGFFMSDKFSGGINLFNDEKDSFVKDSGMCNSNGDFAICEDSKDKGENDIDLDFKDCDIEDCDSREEEIFNLYYSEPIEYFKQNFDVDKDLIQENLKTTINKLKDLDYEGENVYDYVIKKSEEEGVNPSEILILISIESVGDPNAKSQAGAVGLMQLMPDTAKEYGIDANQRNNPLKNIDAGIDYYKDLSNKYDDIYDRFAAYNGGEKALFESEDCSGNLKSYECLWDNPDHTKYNGGYQETREYVVKLDYCLEEINIYKIG